MRLEFRLGDVVHSVLALIPFDRPDLVDDFIRYFAVQRGLSENLVQKAAALVRAALASEAVRAAVTARSWREFPVAQAGPDGMLEGAIDLLIEYEKGATVVDFKTNSIPETARSELESLYAPQIGKYVSVLRSAGIARAAGHAVLLR